MRLEDGVTVVQHAVGYMLSLKRLHVAVNAIRVTKLNDYGITSLESIN